MQSTIFTGQPVFCQILSRIPRSIISKCVKENNSDHYYKTFKSYDHLVSMLFTAFTGCKSLREVATGLQAWHNRLGHLGLKNVPRRSTLSDANQNRTVDFFSAIFYKLLEFYYPDLPDSRKSKKLMDRMFIIDSTTISLFQEILKAAGRSPKNGKRKGGVKAHVLMNATEDTPRLVVLTAGSSSDKKFLRNINLPRGSILVFDKGYNNYSQWKRLSEEGIYWVTRENKAAVSAIIKQRAISEKERKLGVIEDNIVLLGTGINKGTPQLKARRIVFQDPDSGKCLIFVTNHYKFKASKIAQIYKHRWQIEVLFKRLKQNYPLKYFLGDNENAIKIQIWCSLICDLLIKLIKEKGTRRNWSYANLASIIRLHLGTYIDLRRFLDDPDRALEVRNPPPETTQLSLF